MLDVSKWEGLVDWNKSVAAGASAMYCKASQWVADPRFADNWRNAKGVLPRGAYHYLDWGWSEIDQAKLFCGLLKNDPGELPPVLDLELDPAPYKLTAVQVSTKALNFLNYVEKELGRVPMLYTGYYYWNAWGSNNPIFARYPLWLPWYASEAYIKLRTGGTGAPKPWKNWTFWQYTANANGLLYGCQSKSVDGSWFNGTADELRTWINPARICPTCGQVWK
jgi:lysozyme